MIFVGSCQVEFLTKKSVAKLLPRVIPDWWRKQYIVSWEPSLAEGIPLSWLPAVWLFLRTYYPSDLSQFTGLPILALDVSQSSIRLATLSLNGCVILRSGVGNTLSSGLASVLELIGVYIADDLPEYVCCHAAVIGNCVRLPLAEDIVEVMYNAYQLHGGKKSLESVRCRTTAAEKADVRELMARLQPSGLEACHLRFLRMLPVFECVNSGTGNTEPVYRSVEEVGQIAPVKRISIPVVTCYLAVVDDENATKAATVLGAKFVTITAIIKQQLGSTLHSGMLEEGTADCLSQMVVSNFPAYSAEDPSIAETLSRVAFLRTSIKGSLAAPSALFDPECPELRLLLPDADVFPADNYCQPEVLGYLRKMGLKTMKNITAGDLLSSLIHIEKLASSTDTFAAARASSLAMIKFLGSHAEYLWHEVSGRLLLQWASSLCWVVAMSDRPVMYPESLTWCGTDEVLHVPAAVTSDGWALVVGSVQPVVSCTPELARAFGWDLQPEMASIVTQLTAIIASYRSAEKAQYLALLMGVYDSLSRSDPSHLMSLLKKLSVRSWVWHGDGFVSVKQILLRRSAVDLRPYVHVLPPEIESYSPFFLQCGAIDQVSVEVYTNVLNSINHKYATRAFVSEDVATDVQLSVNILNQLAKHYAKDESVCDVFILCQTDDGSDVPVKLLPASECTYCDVDWLRRGFEVTDFSAEDNITFIHSELPLATAAALSVPTLMSRMLHAEELAVTSFGQSEPLTDRLRKLLEDYSDGMAIPKEIIQNADDAGASEVCFLYDERTHEDSMKYLIDEGMRSCQGPALWAYNDAVFTDGDFDSIIRLGGATKESEPEKIGKFGLGFNAVYNVTDVPSFVTRNMLVIFDPHTTHLGRGIKDCSRPGIKINLDKNRMLLRRLPDQFRPYNNVFGCRLNCDENEKVYFDGTLFRLPLRTQEQSNRSEISSLHYSRSEVCSLIQLTAKNAHHLLTFTQNVRRLSFYYVAPNGDPVQSVLLLNVTKDLVKVVRELKPVNNERLKKLTAGASSDEVVTALSVNSGILHAAADYMNSLSVRSVKAKDPTEPPKSSLVLKTTVNMLDQSVGAKGLQLEGVGVTETYWLVSSTVGSQKSLKIAQQLREGFAPAASVACPLKSTGDGKFRPTTLGCGIHSRSRAYCYLPLPVATGLPVHVNGVFALHSNRRHLSHVTEDEKTNIHVEWNNALLEDAVASAYVQMLTDVMPVICSTDKDISLQDLWPVYGSVEPYFLPLVRKFYQCIVSQKGIPLLCRNGTGIDFDSVIFLERSLASIQNVGPVAFKVLSTCCRGKAVSIISDCVYQSFVELGLEDAVQGKMFQKDKFYQEVFFPNIAHLAAATRDSLVLFALDLRQPWLESLIKEHPCIPASPDGSVIRRPCELVHPSSKVACLYTPEDGRFPHGTNFLDAKVLTALARLGLMTNEIGWDDVLERCNSLAEIWAENRQTGVSRQHAILLFIDQLLLRTSESECDQFLERLMNVKLFSVLSKPVDFPLLWAGDEHVDELLCVSDLFTADCQYLVSATCCIVDESLLSTQVCKLLQLGKNRPSLQHVMTQLEHVLSADIQKLTVRQFHELKHCMHAIYGYLQDQCSADETTADLVRNILADRPCILFDRELVMPNVVATDVQCSCAPYLYALPPGLASRYPLVMNVVGVRSKFDVGDYMTALSHITTKSDGKPLPQRELDVAVKMIAQLNSMMKQSSITAAEVEREHGPIMIPNANGRMCAASSLCFNDCTWLTDTSLVSFTHSDITYRMSSCLGVRTKREEALRRYSRGIPFGQKERLTNSLRRLLDSYPFDHEILKELIQNADDAGASQIHFVTDMRQHSDRRVFELSWRPLQGPALCVFNDQPFGDADLEGIQRFGEGSKTADPAATGQYGVGFSSVYHLTDVPLLLTSGADGNKMLCVFDPTCQYVPGATAAEPGMRYDDVDALRKAFPDVFMCFMEEQFCTNGTMFRFPLRSREMAEKSAISKKVVTPAHIANLLEKLKEELFEILLFTNHLEQISISEIDISTGNLTNTYACKCVLSPDDVEARRRLATAKHKMADVVKMDPSIAISAGPTNSTVLTLLLTDSCGCQEKWLVAHRLGFDASVTCPADVENAFREGDLALLPHGSTACLVERRLHGRVDSSNRPGRAFCFLPLPAETELPVHVNGHFALGYENRRHLWTNTDKAGYKRQWNDLLCTEAIAPAYADLLTALRMQLLNVASVGDNVMHVQCSQPMLDSALKAYMSFFPTYSDVKPQWSVLTTAVYQYIEQHSLLLLASVCEKEVSVQNDAVNSPQTAEVINWQISWLPPKGHGMCQVFFRRSEMQPSQNSPAQASLLGKFKGWFGLSSAPVTREKTTEEILSDVLRGCGLKLVESTTELYDNFRRAGVDVSYMTPESVMTFFESCSDKNSAGVLCDLPQKIEDTPFHDEKTLSLVVKYIRAADNFEQRLDRLPLLLRADNMLDYFSSDVPIYFSEFYNVAPTHESLFMKYSYANAINVSSKNMSKVTVFREFGITEMADLLPSLLPAESFCSKEGHVVWKRLNSGGMPTLMWIGKLWQFVHSLTICDAGLSTEERVTLVQSLIQPLQNWCVVPARSHTQYHLYSPDVASTAVVDLCSPSGRQGVGQIVKRLQFPELDLSAMHSDIFQESDPIRSLVVNLEKPYELLLLLHGRLSDDSSKDTVSFSRGECHTVLTYFTENVDKLRSHDAAAQMLRDLPAFTTICGDIICLSGCLVYTLPAKIPTNGIDVWQSRSGTVFLAREDSFQSLYDFLGCASVGSLEVYCQFIFQHFEYFGYEDRLVHLYHVYTNYLQSDHGNISAEERQSLIEHLRNLAFLEDEDGELQRADYFYDPNDVVFQVMQPASRFAARASRLFKESEWFEFLSLLGMVCSVQADKFLEFVHSVAAEGRDIRSASALTKSKVLVGHLFSSPRLLDSQALNEVATVAFITPEKVSPVLANICPQYGDVGNSAVALMSFRDAVPKEYEKVCWTSASLLPSWANPQQTPLLPAEKDLITDKLHVQKKPSVDTVLRHFENICGSNQLLLTPNEVKMDVFRNIFRFLDSTEMTSEERERLAKIPSVLVDEGRLLVKPCQTVLNMYDSDEIRPYLYRLPLDVGEHRRLFVNLGTTDRATVKQYAEVLSQLREDAGDGQLVANELMAAYRAVRGLLEALEAAPASVRDVSVPCLYLPTEDGRLVDSVQLVFNDMPAYYERVHDYKLKFIIDMRECGVRSRNADDALEALPARLRPAMLSDILQETLIEKSRHTVSKTRGVAGVLASRLKSDQFQQAVVRLVRHEAFKSGRKIDDETMFSILDRLTTISVYTTPHLMTHLVFKGRPIHGSHAEKSCFVERLDTGISGVHQWNIYIQDTNNSAEPSPADLSQDLLISLAGVINDILSGILRDSVLYLLPALSCPNPDDIAARMDHLNIRVDHSQKSAVNRTLATLPVLGSPVDEHAKQFVRCGEQSVFRPGDYIGYREKLDDTMVYGRVREELQSPNDVHVFLLDLGSGQNGVISSAKNMIAFVRK